MSEPTRRDILRKSGVGVTTVTLIGASVLSPREARARGKGFEKLSPQTGALLERFGEDLAPGAGEAGVAHYIDAQLAKPPADSLLMIRYLDIPPPHLPFYEAGMAALDGFARQRHGRGYARLNEEKRTALIREISFKTPEGWQGPQATVEFLRQMQSQSFDLALQIHGSGIYINPFLTLMGGRQQAGFYLPGQYCPDADFFMPYPQQLSEVERLLRLMTFLGLPDQGTQLEFPLNDIEYQNSLRLLEAHSLTAQQYVCLHPGASSGDRRWDPAEFAQVARQVAAQGYRIVLTGTAAERDLANQVIAKLGVWGRLRPVNLAGRTCLGSLAVLLQHSALLICNDTGISHLAVALAVPSVVVFSNSEVRRWAPSNTARHRVIDSRQAKAATTPKALSAALELLHRQPTAAVMEGICHAQ